MEGSVGREGVVVGDLQIYPYLNFDMTLRNISKSFRASANTKLIVNMGFEYRIRDQNGLYFITCTVHQWVDVFTRPEYVHILLESLRFCQKEKGLRIHAWVIMTNHLHMIVSSDGEKLSDIIRDFKKYTSSQVCRTIRANEKESRRRWLLWLLQKNGRTWFWQQGYHAEEIHSEAFYDSKVEYIHLNPVKAGVVEKEEEYLLSSCADYYGVRKGAIELDEL